ALLSRPRLVIYASETNHQTRQIRPGRRPLQPRCPHWRSALLRWPNSARPGHRRADRQCRSEEHTSELQSLRHLVRRLLLEKKKGPSRTNSRACKRLFAIVIAFDGLPDTDSIAATPLSNQDALLNTT